MPGRFRQDLRFFAETQWDASFAAGSAEALYHRAANTLSGDPHCDNLFVKSGLETGLLVVTSLLASPDFQVRMCTQFALGAMDSRVADAACRTTTEQAAIALRLVETHQVEVRISTRGIARLFPFHHTIALPPQPVDVLRRGSRAG